MSDRPVTRRRFCSPMDRRLALEGPPGIFILDHEGYWRFDASLTRDGTQRIELRTPGADAELDWAYALLRDRSSGFVSRLITTGRALLTDHPRADALFCDSEEEFDRVYEALGPLKVAPEGWLEEQMR